MKKKIFLIMFIAVLIFPMSCCFAQSDTKASLSSQEVMLDGKNTDLSGYLIKGHNYYKIRDIAVVLNGTSKKFNIGYDKKSNSVIIQRFKNYQDANKDSSSSKEDDQEAIVSNQKVKVDGNNVKINGYLINGNNYFKLRDLASPLGFKIQYDRETRKILISTK